MTTFDPVRLAHALAQARVQEDEIPSAEVQSVLHRDILLALETHGLDVDPNAARDIAMIKAMGVLCWRNLQAGTLYKVGRE